MKKTKNFSQKYISIRTQFARISFPSLEFSQCWSTIGGIPYGNPAGGAKQQEGGNEKSGREREVQKRVGDSLSLSEGKGGYETKIKRNKTKENSDDQKGAEMEIGREREGRDRERKPEGMNQKKGRR